MLWWLRSCLMGALAVWRDRLRLFTSPSRLCCAPTQSAMRFASARTQVREFIVLRCLVCWCTDAAWAGVVQCLLQIRKSTLFATTVACRSSARRFTRAQAATIASTNAVWFTATVVLSLTVCVQVTAACRPIVAWRITSSLWSSLVRRMWALFVICSRARTQGASCSWTWVTVCACGARGAT